MADTFTQVYIHSVFIVQDRQCLISGSWKVDLYKYIAGIIKNNKHKLLAIRLRCFFIFSFADRYSNKIYFESGAIS